MVCSGSKRGICDFVRLSQNHTEQDDIIKNKLDYDDRLNWPIRFFKMMCICENNFAGVACESCKSGWQGINCNIGAPKKTRNNILNFTEYDKFIFKSVLNISKYQLSDYLLINSSSSSHCDPVNEENIQFINASIYDTMVYLHFYAARSTISRDLMDNCSYKDNILDFAHKGPAFFTWHRQYLLMFEELLGQIAIAQFSYYNFSLPYWDWINQTTCNACDEDLLGEISANGEDSNGTFYKWKPICPQNPQDYGCHICDPNEDQPILWRSYSQTVDRLPNQKEIDELFTINKYDSEPFNSNSISRYSFRNFAEGYYRYDSKIVDVKMKEIGESLPHQNLLMHNMVHSFINGTWMDLTTSPNDPLFLLHHTFMDKIFEMWLQKNVKSQYPENSSLPVGHHSNDFMVPFIPLIKNKEMFTISKEFGYSYDNNLVGNKLYTGSITDSGGNSNLLYYVVAAVIIIGLLLLLTGLYWICQYKNHQNYQQLQENEEPINKSNYLYNNEKMPLLK